MAEDENGRSVPWIPVFEASAKSFLATVTLALLSASALGADYHIEVLDKNEAPVPGVVVALEPLDGGSTAAPAPAIMDQLDRQFVPHILVVQKGASVTFPNSDSIKHHVYSFSAAKLFEIKLFGGDQEQEVVSFPKAGEVELGCNVHDWMLGYIFVVDTPFFTRTNAAGQALLAAPEGSYELRVWHPRIQDDSEALTTRLSDGQLNYTVRLNNPLLPPYEQEHVGEHQAYD